MFLGIRNFGRGAPAVDFHIIRLIRAIGNIVMGQVGQTGQRICQCLIQFLGEGIHFGNFGLFLGNKRAQAFKFRLIPTTLGGAHLFAGLILFGLRGFGCKDCGTTIAINFQQARGRIRHPTTRQSGIKSRRVFTNGTNIMHWDVSSGLTTLSAGLMHDFFDGG